MPSRGFVKLNKLEEIAIGRLSGQELCEHVVLAIGCGWKPPGWDDPFSDPYYRLLAEAVEEVTVERGWSFDYGRDKDDLYAQISVEKNLSSGLQYTHRYRCYVSARYDNRAKALLRAFIFATESEMPDRLEEWRNGLPNIPEE